LLLLLFVLGKIFNNYCHLWSDWGLRATVPESRGSGGLECQLSACKYAKQ